MKNILKTAILFSLLAMMLLMTASCDSISIKVEVESNETTSVETPSAETTPAKTTPTETIPTETTPTETIPEETEPVECNHEWDDATSCCPYCTKCGYVAYRETGEHTLNDDTYACIKCGKNFYLTAEEAYEIGMSYEKGEYSNEFYYVELTLDYHVNAIGFGRTTVADGCYISVVGGYLTGAAEGSIQVGDTVIYKAKIGSANSSLSVVGKEARLYEVAAYNNITADVTPPEDTPCTHSETEYVPAVDPTCTTDGCSDCWKCALCGEQLTPNVIIPARHTEVTDERVEPTCTKTGLTEGKRCSECGEILVKQNVIPALGHSYGTYTVDEPTTETVILKYDCKNCKYYYTQTITPTDFTITQENRHKIDSIPEYPQGPNVFFDDPEIPPLTEPVYIGALNIPAFFENEGVWYRVVAIGDSAFAYVDFREVVIPNTVTTIGKNAFYAVGNDSLVSVTFAANSQLTSIGADAFYSDNRYSRSCLTDVYIAETDLVTWAKVSFENAYACPNTIGKLHILDEKGNEVTKLVIPNDPSTEFSYEISSYAFSNCCNITELFISHQVGTIGSYAFSNCSNLTSLTVQHSAIFLGDIGSYAFSNCTSLTTITLKDCPIYIWEKSVTKGDNWNLGVPATEVICSDGTVALN